MDEEIDKIVEAVDIVEFIGRYVDLEEKGGEFWGKCPLHLDDDPSFSVNPNKKVFYCQGCKRGGSVIQFLSFLKKISLTDSVGRLMKEFGINPDTRKRSKSLKVLKEAQKMRFGLAPVHHEVLDNDILRQFQKEDILEWQEEGIRQTLMDKYNVMVDKKQNKIVYPIYDQKGNLINIKGRTRYKNFKLLKLPKYIYYYKLGTSDFFVGMRENKDSILEKNEVIIFEGIKSGMKAEGWGYDNWLSSETSYLNEYQIMILVSLRCDVIIAYDSDIKLKEIKENVKHLKRFTNVYAIYDKNKLLGEPTDKLSPVDKGEEVWNELYKQKVRL